MLRCRCGGNRFDPFNRPDSILLHTIHKLSRLVVRRIDLKYGEIRVLRLIVSPVSRPLTAQLEIYFGRFILLVFLDIEFGDLLLRVKI